MLSTVIRRFLNSKCINRPFAGSRTLFSSNSACPLMLLLENKSSRLLLSSAISLEMLLLPLQISSLVGPGLVASLSFLTCRFTLSIGLGGLAACCVGSAIACLSERKTAWVTT